MERSSSFYDETCSFYTTRFDPASLGACDQLENSPVAEPSISWIDNTDGDFCPLFEILPQIPFHTFPSSSSVDDRFYSESRWNLLHRFRNASLATSVELVLDDAGPATSSLETGTAQISRMIRLQTRNACFEGTRQGPSSLEIDSLPISILSRCRPNERSSFRALGDKRSIVFSGCEGKDDPIILLSFDPFTRFGPTIQAVRRETPVKLERVLEVPRN